MNVKENSSLMSLFFIFANERNVPI
jgi:hypothetical protein